VAECLDVARIADVRDGFHRRSVENCNRKNVRAA
jgi:hypothetical protein